jgi:hypothetical protein
VNARLATLATLSALGLAACSADERATEPLAGPSFDIQPAVCDGDFVTIPECEALVALYNSTNGDEWTDATNWGDDNSPCGWAGVTCQNGDMGPVVVLNLFQNNLTGTLPAES